MELKLKLTEIAHFTEWLICEINKDGLSKEELEICEKMADKQLKAIDKSNFHVE